MLDLGTVRPGSTIRIPFSTFDKDDGSSITMTSFAAADILAYKDGGTTERASTAGYTATTDFDSKTGKHLIVIDLADNTTAGFWNAGSEYLIAIDAVTVDAVTTGGWVARFRIGYDGSLLDTTIATLASQTSFTLTVGPAEDDALNGRSVIIHDIASAVQCGHAIILDYTGSTKTVTLAAGTTFTAAAGDNVSVMGLILADVISISGDSTAADNLELAFDDTAGAVPWMGIVDQGAAQSATGTTVVLRAASAFADDTLIGATIAVFGSTQGYWQQKQITDNALSTDTVTVDAWPVTPSGTLTYKIFASAPALTALPSVNVTQLGGDAQSLTDLKDFADAGYDPSTNKVQGVVLVDTLTTYTSNTPQTGDAYGVVNSGTHGNAALKTLIDTVDNFIDTEIAAIQTTLGTPAGASLAADLVVIDNFVDDLESRLTAARAGYLDNINTGSGLTALRLSSTGIDDLWDEVIAGTLTARVALTVSSSGGMGLFAVNDASATTTSFVTTLTETAANFYRDMQLTWSGGTLPPRIITASSGTSGNITVTLDEALPSAPTNGLAFVVGGPHTHTVSSIADAVLDEAMSGHTTAGTLGKAIADTLVDTNELQTDWADGGRLDLILDARASQSSVNTIDDFLDTEVAAILAAVDTEVAAIISAIGTPSNLGGGASLAANLADIEAQTDDIGTAGAGLSALPWNAAWDAEVQSEVTDALTTALSEPSARATNATGSVSQLLYELIAHHGRVANSGTTKQLKNLAGSNYKAFTYDNAALPTTVSEA